MARVFCIPGIILLFVATMLLLLSSISLPIQPAFDLVSADFGNNFLSKSTTPNGLPAMQSLRLGIWGYCYQKVGSSDWTCRHEGVGYDFQIFDPKGDNSHTIQASWTRGTVITVVALAATVIAFALSFSEHVFVTLLSSLTSFFAALVTLLAFIIDIVLFVYARHEIQATTIANVHAGSAFWMTLAAFILLLLAGCTVCFGRRQDKRSRGTGAYAQDNYPLKSSRQRVLEAFQRN